MTPFKARRSIAFLADLHIGSPFAPWPEGFKTQTGFKIVPSAGQQQLNEYFKDFLKACNKYKVDTVISLSEIIDGGNRKEYGQRLVTADLGLQVDAAVAFLRPLVKNREFFGVTGSMYHNSLDMDAEAEIIKQLGGTFLGRLRNLQLKECGGFTINVAHGEGGNYIYKGTKEDRELLWAKVLEGNNVLDFHIDLFARGHLHYYGYMERKNQAYIACPCWTDWIPYRPSLMLYGRQPDIGWVILQVARDGDFRLRKKLYQPPNIVQKQFKI